MKLNRDRKILIGGVLLALAMAVGLAQWASAAPDGLEHTATGLGLAEGEPALPAALPDYTTPGVRSGWGSRAVAGGVGVLAVLAAGGGLGYWMRRPAVREERAG